MKKVEIDEIEIYNEKAYRLVQNNKPFFIPKVAVVAKDDFEVILEDWLELKEGIEWEEVTLADLLDYEQQPKDKYLTGVDYIYNPKCLEVQNEAIAFCTARKFALINLWTGSGKTFIYLGIIDTLAKEKNFIVCPTNLKKQLEGEIRKHFPHLEEKIEIITYPALSKKEIADYGIDSDTVLIFDEVHRIKNGISLSPPILSGNALKFAQQAGYVYGGSATVSPNGSHDLFGIMRVIHEEFRHTKTNAIRSVYCRIRNSRIIGIKNIIDFANEVAPYIFYRNRNDFEDIPYEERYIPIYLSEQRFMDYKEKYKDDRERNPHTNIFGAMALMKKYLYQVTWGGEEKRAKLWDIVKDIEGQVIIFVDTVNTEANEVEQVALTLGYDHCAYMVGGMKTLDKFISGEKHYLICSYGSGSEGLNLQFCSNIIFYGHNFSYTNKQQAYGRIRRYGQKEVCNYYHLYYHNSVEGAYISSINRKKNIVEAYEQAFDKKLIEEKILKGDDI